MCVGKGECPSQPAVSKRGESLTAPCLPGEPESCSLHAHPRDDITRPSPITHSPQPSHCPIPSPSISILKMEEVPSSKSVFFRWEGKGGVGREGLGKMGVGWDCRRACKVEGKGSHRLPSPSPMKPGPAQPQAQGRQGRAGREERQREVLSHLHPQQRFCHAHAMKKSASPKCPA